MFDSVMPILASGVLADLNEARKKEYDDPPAIKMNAKGINAILNGGFKFGQLYCVTAGAQADSSDLIIGLIGSHSRLSTKSNSTVIDSTIAFDVNKLFKALHAHERNTEQAMQNLDRVKIMKVFDTVGLTESIDEMRSSIETTKHDREGGAPNRLMHRSTIADSQAEEDLLSKAKSQDAGIAVKAPHAPGLDPHPTNLLVVRDVSQLFAPVLKVDYTHGQAMLNIFMRSLNEITRACQICTVVFASASSKSASEEDCLSQFRSCTLQPLLGIGLGYLVDMQIYQHNLRIRRPNERIGAETSRALAHHVDAEILEVVQDRLGPCVGRWAAFITNDNGELCDIT